MQTPRHLPLMLALTFSTGIVDAVGFLGLDRVFTGNMTGNVVILGMGLARAEGLPVLGPLVALAGFLTGAAVAGRALRGRVVGWTTTTTVLFAGVAAAMVLLSLVLLVEPTPSRGVALPVTALLGGAMGAQAGTARHVAVREITTVVVTSTITGLAADSYFGNRAGAQASRRGTAVALILLGAAVGALLLRWGLAQGIAAAALVTATVAVLGHRDYRQTGPPQPA